MSVHININEIATTPYRTDIMADYGMKKYYLYADSLREQYAYGNYTFMDVDYELPYNPAIADKLIIFSNVYYTKVDFEKPLLVATIRESSSHAGFLTCSSLYLQYDSDSQLLSLWGKGIVYDVKGNLGDFEWNGRIGCYDMSIVSDVDYTKPFSIHFVNTGRDYHYGSTAAYTLSPYDTLTYTGARSMRARYPRYYNFVSDMFDGSVRLYMTRVEPPPYYANSLDPNGAFRISYVKTSGEIVDLPADHFLGDPDHSDLVAESPYLWSYQLSYIFSTDGHSPANIYIPMSLDEYNATMCANYNWNRYLTWQDIYGDFSQYED